MQRIVAADPRVDRKICLLGTVDDDHASPLDAHDLLQRVNDLHEIALRFHDGVDVLVRGRRLIDDVHVLAALDALGRGDVLLDREALARLGALHRAPRAVAAALEALRVTEPAHDV